MAGCWSPCIAGSTCDLSEVPSRAISPSSDFKPAPPSRPLSRPLDRRHVDLLHLHHCLEHPLRGGAVLARHRIAQRQRRDLPGHAPAVAAPAALALLAAVADDGIPVAIGFGLVARGDLEREGLALLESGATVDADAVDAENTEFHHQHIAF